VCVTTCLLASNCTPVWLAVAVTSLFVQEACEEDLVTTCSTSLKEMEEDEAKRSSALKCLQQFRDELHSQACRDQVCSPAAACGGFCMLKRGCICALYAPLGGLHLHSSAHCALLFPTFRADLCGMVLTAGPPQDESCLSRHSL
jgi:hypothetical protein